MFFFKGFRAFLGLGIWVVFWVLGFGEFWVWVSLGVPDSQGLQVPV